MENDFKDKIRTTRDVALDETRVKDLLQKNMKTFRYADL